MAPYTLTLSEPPECTDYADNPALSKVAYDLGVARMKGEDEFKKRLELERETAAAAERKRMEAEHRKELEEVEAEYEAEMEKQKAVAEALKQTIAMGTMMGKMSCGAVERGQKGELMVKNILSDMFGDASVEDTTGKPGHADIHMHLVDGKKVVFEVKNKKDLVFAADIQKAYEDVKRMKEKYGDDLLCFVFVSLNNETMPSLGGAAPKRKMALERVGDVPMFWLGFGDEGEAAAGLPSAFRAAVKVARFMQEDAQSAGNMEEREALMETKVHYFQGAVQTLKGMLGHIKAIEDAADGVKKGLSKFLDDIGNGLPASRTVDTAAAPVKRKAGRPKKGT